MQVSSSALTVARNGLLESVPDTTLNVAAADATNPRVDIVQWDGTTLSVKQGTAASISTMNAPTPDAGNIPISLIFIYPVGTTIRDLGQQDASGQFNAIFAYYYARRGLYACLLSRQDSTGAFSGTADPVVALPVYNVRSGLYRFEFYGTVSVPDGASALGLQCQPALDGTTFQRVDAIQAYVEGPLASLSNSRASVAVAYSRTPISAGVHRWNPMLTTRNGVNNTLTYRQAELQEIL